MRLRPAALLAAAVAAAVTGAPCRAASVQVMVGDSLGKPLVDAVALLEPAAGKAPVKPMADVEIAQIKRQFAPRVTLVTTGTRVSFPNFDTVRHHVYSFSPIKTFELKLYAGVPGTPVVFDKPGFAVLGCNIHDTMAAWVVVVETPWAAKTGPTGIARIENVPPGAYRLRLWHPALSPSADPQTLAISVGSADLQQAGRLPVRNEP